MVTPEDMKANAEYIHLADKHVDVPGACVLPPRLLKTFLLHARAAMSV
jgi:hypothetical protein